MSDSVRLKSLADSVGKSQSLQQGISHLGEAFSLFSQETARLQEAYTRLQEQFKAVNTEMQRLQKQALLADRMKELGEMAASVAHEIRNPLGGIQGYASLLYRDLAELPAKQKMVEPILEGAKALSRLVERVLDYSKPLEMHLVSTDLGAFVQEVIHLIQVDPCLPPNIEIEKDLLEKPLFVPLDGALMRSALLNLLYNAIQAMPSGGTLSLAISKTKDRAQIAISDTGVGILPEHLEKIFSPFFTTKEKGTGLGLSETYKIVQLHFGTLEVRSAPGKGSTFTLHLPLVR